jgi:steroid 5-alpha reductase family enzyme
MAILWLLQKKWGEADIVDFGWTLCLGFLGVFYAFTMQAQTELAVFVACFAAIWSFRLALHLWRRVQHPGEDGRYIALREHWGKDAQKKFFIFFQAQALLAVFLSLSFVIPLTFQTEISNFQLILSLLWFAISISGEALADAQLNRFKSQPDSKGKTCRIGLWNYSRHPNYFFEWLYWFSYTFLAFGSDYWVLTLISPMLLLYSILKITGIPPTEERALKTRGDDYREYQRTTSAFFPWFNSNKF